MEVTLSSDKNEKVVRAKGFKTQWRIPPQDQVAVGDDDEEEPSLVEGGWDLACSSTQKPFKRGGSEGGTPRVDNGMSGGEDGGSGRAPDPCDVA